MQAAIVVEAAACRRRGTPPVACDHDRIGVHVWLWTWHRRDEGDLTSVRRPGESIAEVRQRRVRAVDFSDPSSVGPVCVRDNDAGLAVVARANKRDLSPI